MNRRLEWAAAFFLGAGTSGALIRLFEDPPPDPPHHVAQDRDGGSHVTPKAPGRQDAAYTRQKP